MQSGTQSGRRSEAKLDLIARARHEPSAFGELYDHYLPRVYAFCRTYARNKEEAEDLTAQTFERALVAMDRYQERGIPFSSWLLRIAANARNDHARKAQRDPQLGGLETPDSPDEGQVERWEQAYWLRSHVRALPDDQQEVVRLRFFEDRSFMDVANRMGRSEGAVKQLLRRALKALHRQIQEERARELVADV